MAHPFLHPRAASNTSILRHNTAHADARAPVAANVEPGTISGAIRGVESQRGVPMNKQFDVVVERDSEGYFVASVPLLPGCHTQARSLDELMSRIREAIELCLEVQGQWPEDLDFVGVQRVTVEA